MKGNSFGAKLYTGHSIVQYFNRLKFSPNPKLEWFSCESNSDKLCAQNFTESRRKHDARQCAHYINWYLSSWQHW